MNNRRRTEKKGFKWHTPYKQDNRNNMENMENTANSIAMRVSAAFGSGLSTDSGFCYPVIQFARGSAFFMRRIARQVIGYYMLTSLMAILNGEGNCSRWMKHTRSRFQYYIMNPPSPQVG